MEFEIVNPTTTRELLEFVKKFQHQRFRFAAGCTDLLMELRKSPDENMTLINLTHIKDAALSGIKKTAGQFRLGAMTSAHTVVMNKDLKTSYALLHQAALSLGSTQIRQVATVGGNLCTASPSGDIACALVALDAKCELLAASGKSKLLPISEFFCGVRQTALKKNEMLYGVALSANLRKAKHLFSNFIKIGTRRSMECSVVSLAYHIQTDKDFRILKAGVAIGASAPTIRFAASACDFLVGKIFHEISDQDKVEFSNRVLSYASPISDMRATAWYRKQVLFNISKSIFE